MRDAAGIGEHDEQHTSETDQEACGSQACYRLGQRKSSYDRHEERGRVSQDRSDGPARALGPHADSDLRQRRIAEPDSERPEPQPPRPRQTAPHQGQHRGQ